MDVFILSYDASRYNYADLAGHHPPRVENMVMGTTLGYSCFWWADLRLILACKGLRNGHKGRANQTGRQC